MGTLDAYGYLQIKGRIKDMIIRGGENIYPMEIEQFLHKHPKVKEAQVRSHTRDTSQIPSGLMKDTIFFMYHLVERKPGTANHSTTMFYFSCKRKLLDINLLAPNLLNLFQTITNELKVGFE